MNFIEQQTETQLNISGLDYLKQVGIKTPTLLAKTSEGTLAPASTTPTTGSTAGLSGKFSASLSTSMSNKKIYWWIGGGLAVALLGFATVKWINS